MNTSFVVTARKGIQYATERANVATAPAYNTPVGTPAR